MREDGQSISPKPEKENKRYDQLKLVIQVPLYRFANNPSRGFGDKPPTLPEVI